MLSLCFPIQKPASMEQDQVSDLQSVEPRKIEPLSSPWSRVPVSSNSHQRPALLPVRSNKPTPGPEAPLSEEQRAPEGQDSNWLEGLLTTFSLRWKFRLPRSDTGQSSKARGGPASPSMHQLEEPHIDIIKAETEYGISFLQRYKGIFYNNGHPEPYFQTYYQTNKEGIIFCPTPIDASQIKPDQRSHVRFLLNYALDWIPEHDLDVICTHYNIPQDEVLAVYPKDSSTEVKHSS